MTERPPPPRLFGVLTLARSRAILGQTLLGVRGRYFATTIAVGYGLIALLVGQMLYLGPTLNTDTTVWVLTRGLPWWSQGIIVEAPNAVLQLPLFATVSMVLVAAGIGLGMTVALILSAHLYRRRAGSPATASAVSSVMGLTPAMIALLTLGACCSTTAAATAGIGIEAQASGTNLAVLLANSWYLNVFQLAVMYVALVAQEQLVTVYSVLFEPSPALEAAPAPTLPLDRRSISSALLRVALVLAGVTWALAMLAQWTSTPPAQASAGQWVEWILVLEVPAVFALYFALFTRSAVARWSAFASGRWSWAVRAPLLVAAVGMLGWMPAAVATAGFHGLLNEVSWALGASAMWAPVNPGVPGGLALALRWVGQYVLLGAFAFVAAVWPRALRDPLSGSTGMRSSGRPVAGLPAHGGAGLPVPSAPEPLTRT
jgi:hypothetical protein